MVSKSTKTPDMLAAGDVDPTFGDDGYVLIPHPDFPDRKINTFALFTNTGSAQETFYSVARDGNAENPQFLVRLLKDGALDTGYGEGGYVRLPRPDIQEPPYPQRISFTDAVFDEFGGITLFGTVAEIHQIDPPLGIFTVPMACRVKPDGSIDMSIGKSGLVTYRLQQLFGEKLASGQVPVLEGNKIPETPDKGPRSGTLSVQSGTLRLLDGKIMFLANLYEHPSYKVHVASYVARVYASDLRLDESFGDRGLVVITDGAEPSPLRVVGRNFTVDNLGNFTVAGDVTDRAIIIRYKFDGLLDEGFGNGGRVLLSPSQGVFVNVGMIVGMGPRIAVLNAALIADRSHAQLFVLRHDGVVDPSFNEGNPVVLHGPDPYGYSGVALDEDDEGRFVVSGYGFAFVENGPDEYGAMMFRIMPTGRLDDSFGDKGLVHMDNLLHLNPIFIQRPANIIANLLEMPTQELPNARDMLVRLIG